MGGWPTRSDRGRAARRLKAAPLINDAERGFSETGSGSRFMAKLFVQAS